jgi:hypothetical protein
VLFFSLYNCRQISTSLILPHHTSDSHTSQYYNRVNIENFLKNVGNLLGKGENRVLPVSMELKDKLKQVNETLRKQFPSLNKPSEIRQKLQKAGRFHQFAKFKKDELSQYLGEKSIVGVDGSVNSTKGTEKRVLSVFQALAKATRGGEKWAADVYTPLLEEEVEKEQQPARHARKRGTLLSNLEMEVAIQAMQDWQPKAMLMDGSLLHYHIDDMGKWESVQRVALEENVSVIGVAEEMGTSTLIHEFFPEHIGWADRDLLYGVLEVGEAFLLDESYFGGKMWRAVFRPSDSPVPVGLDGLIGQLSEQDDLIRLVYSLTPQQGRGIPYWLDIVDNQVRVTNALVQTMVEEYIDEDLRRRLLVTKRDERII